MINQTQGNMQARLQLLLIQIRPLLKSSAWVGLTTLMKAISQLLVVKWIAIYFGPATLGLAGQAMSLITILQALAGGGIANGIIRQFAMEANDEHKRHIFLSSSFTYGLIFSTLFLFVFGGAAEPISRWAFGEEGYGWFVMLLGIVAFFTFISTFSQAVLSAQNLVTNIFWAHFFGLTLGMLAFVALAEWLGARGTLLGLLAVASGPTIFFVVQLIDKPWFSFKSFMPSWNPGLKKSLVPFTLIAAIGSALAPIIFVLLRSGIEDKMGWEYVGYWQALLKVTDFIFSFIGLFITSTFYPRVAAAKDADTAIRQAMQFVAPFAALLAIGLLLTGLFGDIVLTLIYTKSYLFLKIDLSILLFGAFFRAIGWLGAFFLMARNHLKTFLLLEIISSATLYLICKEGLQQSFQGLIWGQVIHSVLYLAMISIGILWMKKSNCL